METNLHSRKVEHYLEAVRRRIRHAQRLRATLVVATVALSGLLLIAAVDYSLAPLSLVVRCALAAGWLVAILVAVRLGCQPLLKPITLLQVARWLEHRHPEMEERLSTVLSLADPCQGASASLLKSLTQAAEVDLSAVNIAKEVRAARTTRRWGRPALALATVVLLGLVMKPSEVSRLLKRAFTPFSESGNAGAEYFIIQPGNAERLATNALAIEVQYRGKEHNPQLRMRFEDGREIFQALENKEGKWVYTLDPVKESFRYQVRIGRDESDQFAIKVCPLPEFLDAKLTLEFPDYTGVPEQKPEVISALEAVIETKVTLAGRTNTEIESAWLEMNGAQLAEGSTIKPSGDGRVNFTWKLTASSSGEATVMLKHRLGRTIQALRLQVNVVSDQAPQVVLLNPAEPKLEVRPDEVLDLDYQVTEDFALAKVVLEVQAVGEEVLILDQPLPQLSGNSRPATFRANILLAVGEMISRFPNTKEMRVRVRAEDGKPSRLGGAGVGFSGWLNLRIDGAVESLARQALMKAAQGAQEILAAAIRATQDAHDRMAGLKEQIKTGELTETNHLELKETDELVAATQQQLIQLSEQLQNGIHASEADKVMLAAQTVAKSAENLQNSRLQDAPEARESSLEQAMVDALAAVKTLQAVADALQREQQKVQDLAQLQDLAQQQKELARQANESLTKQPNSAPAEDWQDRQKKLNETLQEQVQQRPEAKAEALKSQARQAAAMAQQAEQMAAAQQALVKQTSEAKSETASALGTLQAKQAAAAQDLARSMTGMPRVAENPALDEAGSYGKQANSEAQQASELSQQGQQQQASEQHKQAAQSFAKTAAALTRAAGEFSNMAGQSAAEPSDPERAEADAGELADALQQASEAAASPQPAQAAAKATAAAESMNQAAQSARRRLQGQPPRPKPAQKSPETPHSPQASPGVPPALAKLGVSITDWEKIQSNLKSEVGATQDNTVPKEYRELVKSYFENLSKKPTND